MLPLPRHVENLADANCRKTACVTDTAIVVNFGKFCYDQVSSKHLWVRRLDDSENKLRLSRTAISDSKKKKKMVILRIHRVWATNQEKRAHGFKYNNVTS